MSKYVGVLGGNIAIYAVITRTGGNGGRNIYTMIDCSDNVLVLETAEVIDKTDGKHFFLVEAIVKEHRTVDGEKQTVLVECDVELINNRDKIRGDFYGKIGDKIELIDVEVTFRRSNQVEWKVTGEYSRVKPTSEYRMIIPYGRCLFVMPYDARRDPRKKKTDNKDTAGDIKYNITGRVRGYFIENGCKATFISPISIQCKNGELNVGGLMRRFAGIGRIGD